MERKNVGKVLAVLAGCSLLMSSMVWANECDDLTGKEKVACVKKRLKGLRGKKGGTGETEAPCYAESGKKDNHASDGSGGGDEKGKSGESKAGTAKK